MLEYDIDGTPFNCINSSQEIKHPDKKILEELLNGSSAKKESARDTFEFIEDMYDIFEADTQVQRDIIKVGVEMIEFLLAKNNGYGNAALDPIYVFSNLSAKDRLNGRMDEKLMRIKNSDVERKNDFVDLAGCIFLKCIQNEWFDFKDLLD